MINWVSIEENLPELGDYSVLIRFESGAWDMAHVQDWFGDITNGINDDGSQKYTRWYLNQGITHWALVNSPEVD